ncbi:hypothetical protein E2C01_009380 [Portunus trituberculatus]|uniref:Uncharacterized protein n=1 Tax=Portunus trituberculatus TaxID=210409 RepID=A0A5B7D4W6_PORTR|nr:hypothetical protein [Portunus trituberculatus]
MIRRPRGRDHNTCATLVADLCGVTGVRLDGAATSLLSCHTGWVCRSVTPPPAQCRVTLGVCDAGVTIPQLAIISCVGILGGIYIWKPLLIRYKTEQHVAATPAQPK